MIAFLLLASCARPASVEAQSEAASSIGQAGEAHVAEADTDGLCCPDPHHLKCGRFDATDSPQ